MPTLVLCRNAWGFLPLDLAYPSAHLLHLAVEMVVSAPNRVTQLDALPRGIAVPISSLVVLKRHAPRAPLPGPESPVEGGAAMFQQVAVTVVKLLRAQNRPSAETLGWRLRQLEAVVRSVPAACLGVDRTGQRGPAKDRSGKRLGDLLDAAAADLAREALEPAVARAWVDLLTPLASKELCMASLLKLLEKVLGGTAGADAASAPAGHLAPLAAALLELDWATVEEAGLLPGIMERIAPSCSPEHLDRLLPALLFGRSHRTSGDDGKDPQRETLEAQWLPGDPVFEKAVCDLRQGARRHKLQGRDKGSCCGSNAICARLRCR